MMRNADTFVASGWFWRAWPLFVAPDDFKRKTEARVYCERNGGGTILRLRYLGDGPSTSSTTDPIEIPPKR